MCLLIQISKLLPRIRSANQGLTALVKAGTVALTKGVSLPGLAGRTSALGMRSRPLTVRQRLLEGDGRIAAHPGPEGGQGTSYCDRHFCQGVSKARKDRSEHGGDRLDSERKGAMQTQLMILAAFNL